ncbi:hypothetical protein L218DRAFT_432134 [Marasmius fiardii PR-910]|nr:hypothetical protein L218DRAFT_432134 [Marasmius fiardii PR-910]
MSGLSPTLIIVRVAHGKCVDDPRQAEMMSSFRVADAHEIQQPERSITSIQRGSTNLPLPLHPVIDGHRHSECLMTLPFARRRSSRVEV